MRTSLIFVVLCLACIVAGEDVVSIGLNKAQGQIYALSTANWLYELDNVDVVQNSQHKLNITSPAFTATHIRKSDGKQSLVQFISTPDTSTQLTRFSLPFANKPIINPNKVTASSYGLSVTPGVFDDRDNIALIASNNFQLSLFNLTTLELVDGVRVYQGFKRSVTAVTYNYKTNRAIVFWYFFAQSTRTYKLFVYEYGVANNKLTQLESTYNEDLAYSKFNNTRANYAAFDAANDKYWILDDASLRLISFNAANLSLTKSIPLPGITYDDGFGYPIALYNFAAQIAYVISDAPTGYYLQEIDLHNRAIRRHATFNTGGKGAATAYLDVAEGNIYVGLFNENGAATLSVVDLGNLSQQIITLKN